MLIIKLVLFFVFKVKVMQDKIKTTRNNTVKKNVFKLVLDFHFDGHFSC